MFNYFLNLVGALLGVDPDQITLERQRNTGRWIIRDGMVAVVQVTWMGDHNQVNMDLDILGQKMPCGSWRASRSRCTGSLTTASGPQARRCRRTRTGRK